MNEALLVMDMQIGIVERFPDGSASLIGTLSAAIDAARTAGYLVIFVRVAFRDGAPEANSHNKSFAVISQSDVMNENAPSTQVISEFTAQPGDIFVTKRRVSAFSGSDLDVVLRSKGIDSLVLAGLTTSGVVLSTLRQAADLDFKITVLSDGCADMDAEVHRVLMEKVFPRQATVLTTREWIDQL